MNTCAARRLQLYGVLAHSGGTSHRDARVFMFWMDAFLSGENMGRNKSIECLRRVLGILRAEGNLPSDAHERVLYLQCDNKEKTWALLAFAGDLVRGGMFTEVHINMLVVGHTHEDIDQVFSRFSVVLVKNSGRIVDNGNVDSFMEWINRLPVWGARNYGIIPAVCNYWDCAFKPVDMPTTSATFLASNHSKGTDCVRAFVATKRTDGTVVYRYRGFMEKLGSTPSSDLAQCARLNEDFTTWHEFTMSKATAEEAFVPVYLDTSANKFTVNVEGDARWPLVMTHGLRVENLPFVPYLENPAFNKVVVKDGKSTHVSKVEVNITTKFTPILHERDQEWWREWFEYMKTPQHAAARVLQWLQPLIWEGHPVGGNFIDFSPPVAGAAHGRGVRASRGFVRDDEAVRASLLMPSLPDIARVHTPFQPQLPGSGDEMHFQHMLERNTRAQHLEVGRLVVYQWREEGTDVRKLTLGAVVRHSPPVQSWPPSLVCMRSSDGVLTDVSETLRGVTYTVRDAAVHLALPRIQCHA